MIGTKEAFRNQGIIVGSNPNDESKKQVHHLNPEISKTNKSPLKKKLG